MSETKKWASYEEVAAHLLNRFAAEFDLGRVEGKQVVPGASGANWEIDAKGVVEDGDGFVIVECKRYTKSRISQEIVGGLVYRIKDTGAAGGILVTPVGFQAGGAKVAAHEGIVTATLGPDSTTSDYILEFLNRAFAGISERIRVLDRVSYEVRDLEGNVIQRSEDPDEAS